MQQTREKKRIVHVTSSLKVGGAEAVLCDLITYLDKDEFEHHVIFVHDGPYRAYLQERGIPVYHITGLLWRYDIFFLIRLFWCIKAIKPYRIHSLLWAANVSSRFIALLMRVPHISAFHNNVRQDGWMRSILDILTMSLSKYLVAVSEHVAESVRRRDRFVPARKVQVIQNGIDCAAIVQEAERNREVRRHLDLTSEHFVIGTVGRLEPVKNVDFLLSVVALVNKDYPQMRCVIIGDGSCYNSLHAQAESLGIINKVYFIRGQSALPYYSLFDCFVQPCAQEGLSRALLEALCFARPCIVRHPDKHHPVIKDNVNGWVVTSTQPIVMANVIRKLLHDSSLRYHIGSKGYEHVQVAFSIEHMVSQYRALFN